MPAAEEGTRVLEPKAERDLVGAPEPAAIEMEYSAHSEGPYCQLSSDGDSPVILI